MTKLPVALAVAAVGAWTSTQASAELELTGVNLGSGAFGGHLALPGEDGKHYRYPDAASVDYFVSKGMNVFRIPFLWERVQRELGGELHQPDFQQIHALVEHATAAGAHVILDPHNYARYHGMIIGTGDVSNADFADLWTRLANVYKDNDKVIFGLVNEPYSVDAADWVVTANAAIAAIRETGAKNLILVPGTAYSGAHSWKSGYYGTPNAEAMLNVVDSGDNWAFEIHQYLDGNSSGTTDGIVKPEIGAERLNVFTQWAKEHGKRAFLGEFAVANHKIGDGADQIGDEALDLLFDHMEEHSDVWMGWAWWAAGPWWNDYMFTLEPKNLGQPDQEDRPAMSVLEPRLVGVPEPTSGALLMGAGALAGLTRRRR